MCSASMLSGIPIKHESSRKFNVYRYTTRLMH